VDGGIVWQGYIREGSEGVVAVGCGSLRCGFFYEVAVIIVSVGVVAVDLSLLLTGFQHAITS